MVTWYSHIRKKTINYLFACLACLSIVFCLPSHLFGSDAPEPANVDSAEISAALYEYESLCNFTDTANSPTSLIYSRGSYSSGSCSELEDRYGHPPAVIVTYVNTTGEDLKVPIPGLTNVTVKKKDGKVFPAIAYRTFSQVGPGVAYHFMSTMTNTLTAVTGPQKTLDLIFIFPDAGKGDLVQIGDLEPVKIK